MSIACGCYLTYDHLGSVRMVTDKNANVISRHDYLPFGEEIPSGVGGTQRAVWRGRWRDAAVYRAGQGVKRRARITSTHGILRERWAGLIVRIQKIKAPT